MSDSREFQQAETQPRLAHRSAEITAAMSELLVAPEREDVSIPFLDNLYFAHNQREDTKYPLILSNGGMRAATLSIHDGSVYLLCHSGREESLLLIVLGQDGSTNLHQINLTNPTFLDDMEAADMRDPFQFLLDEEPAPNEPSYLEVTLDAFYDSSILGEPLPIDPDYATVINTKLIGLTVRALEEYNGRFTPSYEEEEEQYPLDFRSQDLEAITDVLALHKTRLTTDETAQNDYATSADILRSFGAEVKDEADIRELIDSVSEELSTMAGECDELVDETISRRMVVFVDETTPLDSELLFEPRVDLSRQSVFQSITLSERQPGSGNDFLGIEIEKADGTVIKFLAAPTGNIIAQINNGDIIELSEEESIDAFRDFLMTMQQELVIYASDDYRDQLTRLASEQGESAEDMEQGTYQMDFATYYAAQRLMELSNLYLDNTAA